MQRWEYLWLGGRVEGVGAPGRGVGLFRKRSAGGEPRFVWMRNSRDAPERDGKAAAEVLNLLGDEGWELVAADEGSLYLKRPRSHD